MKETKQQVSRSRRKFLRDATISGGVAVAAALPGTAAAVEDQPDEPVKTKDGYRLTKHIQDYYKGAAS